MSKFGWSYPPGCSGPPDDDYSTCELCGLPLDDCECPECPICGEQGNRNCYGKMGTVNGTGLAIHHGMQFNKLQLTAQTKIRISDLQEQIKTEEMYLDWLSDQSENYTE